MSHLFDLVKPDNGKEEDMEIFNKEMNKAKKIVETYVNNEISNAVNDEFSDTVSKLFKIEGSKLIECIQENSKKGLFGDKFSYSTLPYFIYLNHEEFINVGYILSNLGTDACRALGRTSFLLEEGTGEDIIFFNENLKDVLNFNAFRLHNHIFHTDNEKVNRIPEELKPFIGEDFNEDDVLILPLSLYEPIERRLTSNKNNYRVVAKEEILDENFKLLDVEILYFTKFTYLDKREEGRSIYKIIFTDKEEYLTPELQKMSLKYLEAKGMILTNSLNF